MSLLVTSKFLGLFINTMTADDKSYCHYIEFLAQPNQMQLCKKSEVFS